MARSNGPPGGKDGTPTERRPGKGNPWAHAKSKAASARSSSSSGSRSQASKSPSTRSHSGRRPEASGGKPGPRPARRLSGQRAGRATSEQWTDVDGAVLEGGDYPKVDPSLPTVKLQKLLADAGLGSRRELERWIVAGRVTVNGAQATLGDRVTGVERIDVDGKALGARARATGAHARVLLLNKSEGVICTRRDPEGRKTVFADVPTLRGGRWISVGRLDIATTGLLLLTNDGELANRMMHPSTGLDREYAVRTDVVLEDEQLAALKKGIESEGDMLRFADIRYFDGRGANHWYHVVLLEGKNHEVRRLFASVGAEVRRLKRVRYGPVLLPSWLRRGQRFELNNSDVAALYKTLGMTADLPPDRPGRRNDRRGMADRSVLIPYPELPGRAQSVDAKDRVESSTKGAGAARKAPAKPDGGSVWRKPTEGGRTSAEKNSAKSSVKSATRSTAKTAIKSPGNTSATTNIPSKTSSKTPSKKSTAKSGPDRSAQSGHKKDWRKR